MATTYVRVDDRLIHGQTIVAWCPTLSVKEIIAVDDESAANPMLKSIMEMGVPAGYTTHIVNTADAISLLSEESKQNRLLIVRTPASLQALGDAINEVDSVVLGNMAKRSDTVHKLGGATGIFYLSEEDVTFLDELATRPLPISFQQLPSAAKTAWETFKKSLHS